MSIIINDMEEHDVTENAPVHNGENHQGEGEFCLNGKFTSRNCETWFRRKPGGNEKPFCDFQIKLLGSIVGDNEEVEGYWLARISCRSGNRVTALPASFLDNRMKFETTVRKKYGRGLFNVAGDLKSSDLSDYLRFLKNDYITHGMERSFQNAPYIGFYQPNYWVLSETQQIKDGRMLPESEREYFILDNNVKEMAVAINKELLTDFRQFLEIITRIIDLSSCFCGNKQSMLLAMAFTSTQLLKKMFDVNDSADETSHGLIHCDTQNVGKSKSLELVASGIGAPDHYSHPMFLSGGDSSQSGTSPKRIQESLSASNMICIINEARNSSTMAEFILQAHDGYLQGSCASGLSKSRAKILSSSNAEASERIEGRTLKFPFCWDERFGNREDKVLKEELQPLTQNNKGYLIAWVIHFAHFWQTERIPLAQGIDAVLRSELPKTTQRRWSSGMSATLATYSMFMLSANRDPQLIDAIESVLAQKTVTLSNASTFFEELNNGVLKELNETDDNDVLTWLNPCTYVRDKKNVRHPSIAVNVNVFNRLTRASHKETQENLEGDMQSAFCVSVVFAKQGQATYQDLNNKEKTKHCRANKIPQSKVAPEVMKRVRKACGMPNLELNTIEEETIPLIQPRTDGLSMDGKDKIANMVSDIRIKIQSCIEAKLRCHTTNDDSMFSHLTMTEDQRPKIENEDEGAYNNDSIQSRSSAIRPFCGIRSDIFVTKDSCKLTNVLNPCKLRNYLRGSPQMRSFYEMGYKDCLERKGMSLAGDRFNMVIWMENKTQATVDIKFCCGNEEETYQLQHGRKARLRKQVEQSSVRISATTLSGDELLINGETSVQVAVAIDYDTLYIVSDQATSSGSQDDESDDEQDRDSEKGDKEDNDLREKCPKKPRRHCRRDALHDNLSKNYLPATTSRRKRN